MSSSNNEILTVNQFLSDPTQPNYNDKNILAADEENTFSNKECIKNKNKTYNLMKCQSCSSKLKRGRFLKVPDDLEIPFLML